MAESLYKKQKIIILGANINALELAQFFSIDATEVVVYPTEQKQLNDSIREKLTSLKVVKIEEGDIIQNHLETAQLIVLADCASSGGEAKVIEQAKIRGIPVKSELEIVCQHISLPTIGVAGTCGKTTTLHFLEKFLTAHGKKVASNFNTPLSALLNLHSVKADYLLVKVNTFMLEGANSFKPQTLLFLNVHEDFTERYPSVDIYLNAHRETLKNVNEKTTVVVNGQDPNIVNFVQGLPGRYIFFGAHEIMEGFEGAWSSKDHVFARLKDAGTTQKFSLAKWHLRGMHNKDNLAAAVSAALTLGVPANTIQKTIEEIRPLPQRLKFCRRIHDVCFYDDSASQNTSSVLRALNAFSEPILLIMGGKDRGIDYAPLAPYIRQHCKNLILIGDNKEKINRALGDFTETFIVGTIEEASLIGYQKSRAGEIVLFSPGSGYNDIFNSVEERSEAFQNIILGLAQPRKPNVL